MVAPTNGAKRKWRGRLARIAAVAASWESAENSERLKTVSELVALAGDADPIVGYAAKEALLRLLCGASAATAIRFQGTRIVRSVVLVHTLQAVDGCDIGRYARGLTFCVIWW